MPVKTVLLAAVCAVLVTPSPASGQDGGLGPATHAGRVTVDLAGSTAFADAPAGRSVRRALRRHGFSDVHASCVRERGAKPATCTVSAVDAVGWSGTATVTRRKHAHRVDYDLQA
jgi:hypothetical protein